VRILIDTNVILDDLLAREPFFVAARRILTMSEMNLVEGYISASAATDIFYIIRKEFNDTDRAYVEIEKLLNVVGLWGVDSETIKSAIEFKWKDFEDCVQYVTARDADADYIITRNTKDYKDSEIVAISPDEFLNIVTN
jgi:predicted nucleic acid-binding protein